MNKAKKSDQPIRTWSARIRVTHSATVEVLAVDEEAARERIKAGDWNGMALDDLVDWSDPTSITEER